MKVYVYGSPEVPIIAQVRSLLAGKGIELTENLDEAFVGLAPLLSEKLAPEQLNIPQLGTLIFHPSLLPRHRGSDAIKWAFHEKEAYSGATWFWADEHFDTGDICEMEVLSIEPDVRPRDYYQDKVIPCALRMLESIIDDLEKGYVHRRPQDDSNATYEDPFVRQ
jgi:formyltetrahydrofolate dehydrogenase